MKDHDPKQMWNHNILAASKQIILFFRNAKIFQNHFFQREIFCEGK